MLGLGGIPSAWRSPTTRCPRGNTPPHRRPSLACLPLGHRVVALGEVDGMPSPIAARLNARVSPSRRSAGVRGGERPQLVPSNLVSGSAQDANLRSSD